MADLLAKSHQITRLNRIARHGDLERRRIRRDFHGDGLAEIVEEVRRLQLVAIEHELRPLGDAVIAAAVEEEEVALAERAAASFTDSSTTVDVPSPNVSCDVH